MTEHEIDNNIGKIPTLLNDLHSCNLEHAKAHPGFDSVQQGQTPSVVYVGCSDSRVDNPFGPTFNKLFGKENAGNRIDHPMLSATSTYSLDHIPQTKILYIVGHTSCGAIAGATTGNPSNERPDLKEYLLSMKEYLDKYKEVVDNTPIPEGMDGKIFRNVLFAEINVDYQVKKAMELYQNLIEAGKITVIGGMYDIHNIYPNGQGIVHPINIEGIINPDEIMKHGLFKDLEDKSIIHRFTHYDPKLI